MEIKSIILILMFIHIICGFIWWRIFIKNKITGTDYSDVWESIALWTAVLGGVFVLFYDIIFNKQKTKVKDTYKVY